MSDERQHTPEELDQALFANLVMMLAASTMQQLGKTVDPMTNKTEINLPGAQVTIDMLTMLQNKTKGNLAQDEEKMMNDLLASLRMNYVETANTTSAAPEQEKKEDKPDTVAEPAADKAPDDKKDPKYHKSYGE
jgi:hypothetical protein